MKVQNWNDVPGVVMAEGLQGVTMQVLIGRDEGADNFVMRRFTLEPGAHTPHHDHDWEHEVLILDGEAVLVDEGGDIPMKPGDTVLVPQGVRHQFRNTGSGILRFICLVPMKGAT